MATTVAAIINIEDDILSEIPSCAELNPSKSLKKRDARQRTTSDKETVQTQHYHHQPTDKHDEDENHTKINLPSSEAEDETDAETETEDEIWENSSFIEAAFEQLEDSHIPTPNTISTGHECTAEESVLYRRLLHQAGVQEFIRQTLETGEVSARKLCTAFGLRVPFLEGRPDEAYYKILGLAIQRELQKRIKLAEWNTIDDAVRLLVRARNVIVVTGAGISTSLGIPDFRSKHNGLYARLEHLGLSDPQEVFDVELFREDPTVFYSVAKDILPETKRFTPTHGFVKMLQDRGKLLVNYTQNIDNIEDYAGVEAGRLIQCHGSFATATCQKCWHKVDGDEIHDDIKAGRIPKCAVCVYKAQQFKPVALKRKRSSDHRSRSGQRKYEDTSDEEEEDFAEEPGVMKVKYYIPAQFSIKLLTFLAAGYHFLRRKPARYIPRPSARYRLLNRRSSDRYRHQFESRPCRRNPEFRVQSE